MTTCRAGRHGRRSSPGRQSSPCPRPAFVPGTAPASRGQQAACWWCNPWLSARRDWHRSFSPPNFGRRSIRLHELDARLWRHRSLCPPPRLVPSQASVPLDPFVLFQRQSRGRVFSALAPRRSIRTLTRLRLYQSAAPAVPISHAPRRWIFGLELAQMRLAPSDALAHQRRTLLPPEGTRSPKRRPWRRGSGRALHSGSLRAALPATSAGPPFSRFAGGILGTRRFVFCDTRSCHALRCGRGARGQRSRTLARLVGRLPRGIARPVHCRSHVDILSPSSSVPAPRRSRSGECRRSGALQVDRAGTARLSFSSRTSRAHRDRACAPRSFDSADVNEGVVLRPRAR